MQFGIRSQVSVIGYSKTFKYHFLVVVFPPPKRRSFISVVTVKRFQGGTPFSGIWVNRAAVPLTGLLRTLSLSWLGSWPGPPWRWCLPLATPGENFTQVGFLPRELLKWFCCGSTPGPVLAERTPILVEGGGSGPASSFFSPAPGSPSTPQLDRRIL